MSPNSPAAIDFAAGLARKPELDLKTFQGSHDIRAAVSPDCSFQLLRDALQSAQSELLVYIYNASAGHVLALLSGAKRRGVAVRVMYDATDTSGAEVQKLAALKVELKIAPSRAPRRVFTVCHQKFAVVDSKLVVLGSANWAASSIPERQAGGKRKKGNREWLLRIDHSGVAKWYRDLFQADWDIPEDSAAPSFDIEAAGEEQRFAVPFDPPLDLPVKHFAGLAGPLTPLVSPDNYFTEVKRILDGAKTRIWVQQQYIVGGAAAPSIEKFLKTLADKRTQGVAVRIMVSSRFASGWSKTKDSLERHGLLDCLKAINLDQFVHCHNKGVICDDSVVVTSTNWSENSVRRAREAGVLIRSRDLANYYGAAFDDDWENGWTVAQGDAGPSFDLETAEGAEIVPVHPADQGLEIDSTADHPAIVAAGF